MNIKAAEEKGFAWAIQKYADDLCKYKISIEQKEESAVTLLHKDWFGGFVMAHEEGDEVGNIGHYCNRLDVALENLAVRYYLPVFEYAIRVREIGDTAHFEVYEFPKRFEPFKTEEALATQAINRKFGKFQGQQIISSLDSKLGLYPTILEWTEGFVKELKTKAAEDLVMVAPEILLLVVKNARIAKALSFSPLPDALQTESSCVKLATQSILAGILNGA